MRAIVQRRYGPLAHMELAEREIPDPGPGQVLVRVAAAGVDPSIWHLMTGTPYLARLAFGVHRPRIQTPGWDAAGAVAALGEGVEDLRIGQEVFGAVRGSFAEYALGRAENLAPKPADVTFEQAAVVPTSAITALQAVRDKGEVTTGQRVAVIGAGGGVGSFAVQLAAQAGAEVTGVCSTAKVGFVRSLGATQVIDYTVGDITECAEAFDVIVDCAGNRSLRSLRRVLKPRGSLVIVGGESDRPQMLGVGRALRAGLMSPFVAQQLRGLVATTNGEDLRTLADALGSGVLTVPVDRTFPLEDAIEAVQYVRDGSPHGKVAVLIGNP